MISVKSPLRETIRLVSVIVDVTPSAPVKVTASVAVVVVGAVVLVVVGAVVEVLVGWDGVVAVPPQAAATTAMATADARLRIRISIPPWVGSPRPYDQVSATRSRVDLD